MLHGIMIVNHQISMYNDHSSMGLHNSYVAKSKILALQLGNII